MNSFLAITIGIGLQLVFLAPLAFAGRPGRVGDAAMAFYPLAAIVVIVWHFGYVGGPAVPAVSFSAMGTESYSKEACQQVRDRITEMRLVLDDSQPGRVVVDANGWRQIPGEIRTVVSECYRVLNPGVASVEIVESNP